MYPIKMLSLWTRYVYEHTSSVVFPFQDVCNCFAIVMRVTFII